MLTIDKNQKRSSLPDHILEGLNLNMGIYSVKHYIALVTLLMLDVPLCFNLLLTTLKYPVFLYQALVILCAIHIWAIRLLIKKYKQTQIECLLYFGFLGFIGSFMNFFLMMVSHFSIGITSPLYFVFMTFFYCFSIYLFSIREHKKYSSLKFRKVRFPYWQDYVSMFTPGVVFALFVLLSGPYPLFPLGILSLFFCWTFAYFFTFFMAKSFYRYFFIKRNIYHVRFEDKELNRKYRMQRQMEQQEKTKDS